MEKKALLECAMKTRTQFIYFKMAHCPLSIHCVPWILHRLALPKELCDKIEVLQSFERKAEQSWIFIAVTSLGCLRARWQLYCTAATTAGFCTMHVNDLVQLKWVSQSCTFAFQILPASMGCYFRVSSTLHKHFTASSLKIWGDVLRGSTRVVWEVLARWRWPSGEAFTQIIECRCRWG